MAIHFFSDCILYIMQSHLIPHVLHPRMSPQNVRSTRVLGRSLRNETQVRRSRLFNVMSTDALDRLYAYLTSEDIEGRKTIHIDNGLALKFHMKSQFASVRLFMNKAGSFTPDEIASIVYKPDGLHATLYDHMQRFYPLVIEFVYAIDKFGVLSKVGLGRMPSIHLTLMKPGRDLDTVEKLARDFVKQAQTRKNTFVERPSILALARDENQAVELIRRDPQINVPNNVQRIAQDQIRRKARVGVLGEYNSRLRAPFTASQANTTQLMRLKGQNLTRAIRTRANSFQNIAKQAQNAALRAANSRRS
jgi:hypothetical protein